MVLGEHLQRGDIYSLSRISVVIRLADSTKLDVVRQTRLALKKLRTIAWRFTVIKEELL